MCSLICSIAETRLTTSWLTKPRFFPDAAWPTAAFHSETATWLDLRLTSQLKPSNKKKFAFFTVLKFGTNNLYSGWLTDLKSSSQCYILYSTGSAAATCARVHARHYLYWCNTLSGTTTTLPIAPCATPQLPSQTCWDSMWHGSPSCRETTKGRRVGMAHWALISPGGLGMSGMVGSPPGRICECRAKRRIRSRGWG